MADIQQGNIQALSAGELTPDQKNRRRQLLLRKRELLTQQTQTDIEQPNILEKTGQFIQKQLPEIADEGSGLVPESLQRIGSAIESRTPEVLKPGLKIAADVAKGQVFPPIGGFGSKLAVERPQLVGRTASLAAPITRAPEAAGLLARLGTQQIVPPEVSPVPGIIAEAAGGLGTAGLRGLGRAGVKKLRELRKAPFATRLNQAERGVRRVAIDKAKALTTNIGDDVKTLEKGLQQVGEKGAVDFQKKLPDFFKRNSQSYGDRIGGISDDLAKKGNGVTRGDMQDIITSTLQEADDLRLTTGRGRELIEDFGKKWSAGAKELGGKGLASEAAEFAEIVKDYRKINKTISAGAQRGATGFAEEDIIVALFRKNFGEIVGQIVPEFKKLNTAYAPIIRAMKKAHTIFKPFKGEFDTKAATNFLKRAGVDKLEAGELRVLKTLEEGSEFGKGVGGISKRAVKVGKKIGARKELGAVQRKGIETQKRTRLTKIEDIKIKKQIADQIRKALIGGGIGVSVLGGAIKGIQSLGRLGNSE